MATKKEPANEQEQMDKAVGTADAAREAEEIIAQARAEADKILADAKAAAVAQAEAPAPSPAPAASRDEELVPIRLFKDNERYKDDVFVAVNGERVQIRRGETVRIKRKFAQVLEQSMRQDTATARLMEQKAAEYEANAKALNLYPPGGRTTEYSKSANTQAAATRRGKARRTCPLCPCRAFSERRDCHGQNHPSHRER